MSVRGEALLWLSDGPTRPPALDGLRPRALEKGPFTLEDLADVRAVLCRDGDSPRLRRALALLVDRGAPLLAWGEGARALARAVGGAVPPQGTEAPSWVEFTPEGLADPLFLGRGPGLQVRLGGEFGHPLSRESVTLARGPGGEPAALRLWGLPAYGLRFDPGPLLDRFLDLYTQSA